jgi:hypothetical protein
MKQCYKCKNLKDLSCFSKDKSRKDNKADRCKECKAIEDKEYLKKNPDKNKKGQSLRLYGITLEQRRELIYKQNNKCAICEKEMDGPKEPSLDHNHITGKLREFLCLNCNYGLGNFKDNLILLRKAAAYIERHTKE